MALTGLTGCGSSESPAPAPPRAASSAASVPAEGPGSPQAANPGPSVAGVPALTGNPTDLTKASQAQVGMGKPPTTVLTQDVVVGNGAKATAEDTVEVRYTGTLYASGTVFDSSWSRGDKPVSFPLSNVVPGFVQGITGMRQGGRRVIVIPPALGYGDSTDGPIPGGSTLVFVVDLIGVT
jgi:peptidylprolyl isomerase